MKTLEDIINGRTNIKELELADVQSELMAELQIAELRRYAADMASKLAGTEVDARELRAIDVQNELAAAKLRRYAADMANKMDEKLLDALGSSGTITVTGNMNQDATEFIIVDESSAWPSGSSVEWQGSSANPARVPVEDEITVKKIQEAADGWDYYRRWTPPRLVVRNETDFAPQPSTPIKARPRLIPLDTPRKLVLE